MAERVLVEQADITKAVIDNRPDEALGEGEVRLKLESFALTTNNVTYAVTGFQIGYWRFFPAGRDGQGIVPVWGVARVVESRSESLTEGTRLYGFYPMAESLVISPKAQGEGVIVDAAEHRAELPVVYNTYAVVRDGAERDDYVRALLQPLLATSYLLFDWLSDNAWFGAEQIIIGSASSKTGLGLCKFLAEPEERTYRIVGLTSEGNCNFVEALGACDEVRSYAEIDGLAQVPSVYVDMAGNSDVKRTLHTRLADHLKYSTAVGMSHWDKFTGVEGLAGPKPQFFFAPSQIVKRREEWGPGVIEQKITAAWKRVAEDAESWLDLRLHDGLEAAQAVYTDLANGKVDPKEGHVIRL